MKKQVIIEIICFLFILLFIYAAITKLMDYQKFIVQIGQSPLLTPLSTSIAWVIPSLEILIAFTLAVPKIRIFGFYAAFSLMVMFTTYIIAILNFSDYIPCSCGGILESMNWNQHLLFNTFFVLFALMGIILQSGMKDHRERDHVIA